ncbi:uncharacterized protein [Haliaeetus albicilla]|uniref:uncharacterized protein isoform X4 n=1 Tax=Haliaeetus albicilla TaxID=8969 RepID=UPI0037E7685D
MPGAVVLADSAAGRQCGSRARRSPRCRRGPRSPTRSDAGALPVSRGFPQASRCTRSPTSRADAPPGRVRRPARGAARRSLAGSGPSGACAVPGSSVAARRARVSAAAGERRDRGGHAVGAVVRSSPGDAVDCSRLRLAWAVSAWPPSPRGAGAQRDRRSACWLWTGAAEAGEATERC